LAICCLFLTLSACGGEEIILPSEDEVPLSDGVSSATVEVDIPESGEQGGLPLTRQADASFDGELPGSPELPGEALTCALTVSCAKTLYTTEALPAQTRALLPPDGLIFEDAEAAFYDGESVFDVLRRELARAGISFSYSETPGDTSPRIESIADIDEGVGLYWHYRVNGEFTHVGCGEFVVSIGDIIEVFFVVV
jgi:hypothetical protein